MTTNEFYIQKIWSDVLNEISKTNRIEQEVFDMYITTSKMASIDENEAVIVAPNFIHFTMLNSNRETIEDCLETTVGQHIKVKFIQQSDYDDGIKEQLTSSINLSKELDQNYTFTNFVIGKSNISAQLASRTVAENLGALYNPLFIYGNSGLGKTHLLNAIGNRVKSLKSNARICLISGLDFVEGVYRASKDKTLDEFKASFRNLDLLLVDDIQFIAGKDKTHEVFFSVFNDLINNRKQVCITADRLPADITGLEERIISRFNQGLSVNIEAPEFETSLSIVKMKISNNTINTLNIDDEVLSYIATNFSTDVRSLEGAINRLLFYAINFADDGDRITLKLATEAFRDQLTENKGELSVKKIKKVVCDYYNLTATQLVSKNKTANISTARHIAMYLCRRMLDCPYQEIGNEFGKRDHSTVMSACEKVEKEIKTNSLYLKAINEIEAKLR